jgi:cytochrome c-type biogenesis protein CcmH
MSRWLPIVGLVVLAALIILVLVRPGSEPTPAQRADMLAAQLRCPDCQGLSVADSPTRSAGEIRRQIDELVAGGATDEEVRARFVARYGEWVLLAPSSAAYWLIPFAVLVAGVAVLILWMRARPTTSGVTPGVSDEQRQRVHDEVEALDA